MTLFYKKLIYNYIFGHRHSVSDTFEMVCKMIVCVLLHGVVLNYIIDFMRDSVVCFFLFVELMSFN